MERQEGIIALENPPEPVREHLEHRENESFSGPLLPADASEELRSHWESIQSEFVDEPRKAVQKADQLVTNAIERLSASFTAQRTELEQQWSRGGDVSTEDLRQAFRRYRAFFQRLLAI